MAFTRCDQCRSRSTCESARRCAIIDGEHGPSAAFFDLPYDWHKDAESDGGECD